MSVEDFYMKIGRTMFQTTHIEIIAAEGSMKSELEVSLPDFEDALDDVEDYLCDRFMKPILIRAENAHEDGKISDDEFNIFKAVMKVIEAYEGVLPFSENVSPEIIRREFGLSKNAFKRAVGRLLKQGRIRLGENRIFKETEE